MSIPFEFEKDGSLRRGVRESGCFVPLLSEKEEIVVKPARMWAHSGHHVCDVEFCVPVSDYSGEVIKIKTEGGYCVECNRYFISPVKYFKLKDEGFVRVGVANRTDLPRYEEYLRPHWTGRHNYLADESILHRFGYNVGQHDDLSAPERRRILQRVLKEKAMTKRECMALLRSLIARAEGRTNADMSSAISRWQQDLRFLAKLP